ncbi:MAG TPA: hypothetical protein VNO75_01925 [Gemmatimonadaceae bacterium]|nr:hypothetical protein [Gemmatimonadaceae bacterium]
MAFLCSAVVSAACSTFAGQSEPTSTPADSKPAATPTPAAAKIASTEALIGAMHGRYNGKFFKTTSFLQNNTVFTTTGEEQKSQWYEHLEAPGKLRIAFLPAAQRSGLVQVDDRVASFDNGIRIDFRPSVNPLLLLTVDVYSAPAANILRGLDSLGVDRSIIRTDEWEGRPVYVVGAKAGDSTSSQMWVDSERLRLVRFVQRDRRGERTIVSDMRVKNYRDIEGYEVPTEFVVLRNGRTVWREQRADIRLNDPLPPEVFDQARWRDVPVPN